MSKLFLLLNQVKNSIKISITSKSNTWIKNLIKIKEILHHYLQNTKIFLNLLKNLLATTINLKITNH